MTKPKDTVVAELTADLQRTRADFENFRKQADLQKQQYGALVKISTVSKLLPLLDDIERAISVHPDILEPITKNLDKTLGELQLSKIPSEPDTPFNPDLHEAVAVEGDGDTETISETLRPGYSYAGETLRPAMVKVQKSN
ncbi:nucleotide exchange factor GrpE [Candidatus Saccharibacteria bacterium]|nr:nucleotide exchange factor GrpE [Candidatus Saccharibacteria bacterium]